MKQYVTFNAKSLQVNSFVKKHIYSCQNNDYKGIKVKSTGIMSENDLASPRLYEALYIKAGFH